MKEENLVPSSSEHIKKLVSQFEQFLHTDKSLLQLIKAGLEHVQFELIHPFLDGNGRIGRLKLF